jgi:hypothetical protein
MKKLPASEIFASRRRDRPAASTTDPPLAIAEVKRDRKLAFCGTTPYDTANVAWGVCAKALAGLDTQSSRTSVLPNLPGFEGLKLAASGGRCHVTSPATHRRRLASANRRYLPDLETSLRVLQEFLTRFRERLLERVASQSATSVPRTRVRPVHRSDASALRIKVKILERREHGGRVSFLVQEEGKPLWRPGGWHAASDVA